MSIVTTKLLAACLLLFGMAQVAQADVWKWVDAFGKTHFVDTVRPIYTWVDDSGKLHYADHPDHEDAVSVELVWHSKGTPEDAAAAAENSGDDEYAFPGETDEQRAERKRAEAYYCERATEVYESYLNAPKLYKTGADGKREILSEADAARTIEETRGKKEQFCK